MHLDQIVRCAGLLLPVRDQYNFAQFSVYSALTVSPPVFCIQSLLTLVNSVQLCEFQTWIIGKLGPT